MNAIRKTTTSGKGYVVLETLQAAVTRTLEKKKRLGQYAVTWHDGKPVITGDDAPGKKQRAK